MLRRRVFCPGSQVHTTLICDAGIKAIWLPAADACEKGLTKSWSPFRKLLTFLDPASIERKHWRANGTDFVQDTLRNSLRLIFWGLQNLKFLVRSLNVIRLAHLPTGATL
jgi:hypothetical protein